MCLSCEAVFPSKIKIFYPILRRECKNQRIQSIQSQTDSNTDADSMKWKEQFAERCSLVQYLSPNRQYDYEFDDDLLILFNYYYVIWTSFLHTPSTEPFRLLFCIQFWHWNWFESIRFEFYSFLNMCIEYWIWSAIMRFGNEEKKKRENIPCECICISIYKEVILVHKSLEWLGIIFNRNSEFSLFTKRRFFLEDASRFEISSLTNLIQTDNVPKLLCLKKKRFLRFSLCSMNAVDWLVTLVENGVCISASII